MILDSVVSCATRKHLNVWKYTSIYLNKYISAKNYYVIVPAVEISLFKDNTPPNFIILNEEEVISRSKIKCGNWIYQQLLKIEAASFLGPRVLIWDGDTVPLRSMNHVFFPNERDIQIFTSTEHHIPYFNTLSNLLNIPQRLVNFSFIAQCLPVYSEDIKCIKTSIETKHNTDWVHGILNATIGGRFSEYETIGNFILHNNLRKIIQFPNNKWSRHVWNCVNSWEDINKLTEKDLYFASFEITHINAPEWTRD